MSAFVAYIQRGFRKSIVQLSQGPSYSVFRFRFLSFYKPINLRIGAKNSVHISQASSPMCVVVAGDLAAVVLTNGGSLLKPLGSS